jgi:hypothetical protein
MTILSISTYDHSKNITQALALPVDPTTKMKFCNFPKTGPKPLDILEGIWHNTPVADNDEQTASDEQTS